MTPTCSGRLGIIPALAGNTTSQTKPAHSTTDHPRSRGEYLHAVRVPLYASGSSPLSRGIQAGNMADNDEARIIPALAGNTVILRNSAIERKDHPRSRGEYAFHLQLDVWSSGSSPLSRGIPRHSPTVCVAPWIIPALAGNTRHRRLLGREPRDHPRSRGEYPTWSNTEDMILGSSPLSRGILVPWRMGLDAGRIIPALAGNTSPG